MGGWGRRFRDEGERELAMMACGERRIEYVNFGVMPLIGRDFYLSLIRLHGEGMMFGWRCSKAEDLVIPPFIDARILKKNC